MSHRVIVFAVSADEERALDVLSRAGEDAPLIATLSQSTAPVRHGESLVAVGFWSAAVASSGLKARLEEVLSLHPSRSILCSLEDAPPAPSWADLDPGVMIVAHSGAADFLGRALSAAIELARKRDAAPAAATAGTSSGGLPYWIIAAIASVLVLGLSSAGVTAWVSEPDAPGVRPAEFTIRGLSNPQPPELALPAVIEVAKGSPQPRASVAAESVPQSENEPASRTGDLVARASTKSAFPDPDALPSIQSPPPIRATVTLPEASLPSDPTPPPTPPASAARRTPPEAPKKQEGPTL